MNDIFENDYSWMRNSKYGEEKDVTLTPTELNEEKLSLLLVGMDAMCGGWMFVLEQNGKECWVWFDEEQYRYIPIPKVDLLLSTILEQPYFNIGGIQPVLHDIGYDIISYQLGRKQSIFFKQYNERLERFGVMIKGIYLKKKGETNHELYTAN